MLRKLRPRSIYDVFAVLALFVALGGTSAVALSGSNTVFSDDIANDNFNSPTEGQGGLVASDLRAGSVTSSEVANGTLKAEDYGIGSVSGARIQDNNVTTLDLADGAIFSNDVRDNSLTGADVNESTLNLAAEPWHEVGAAGEPPFNPGVDFCSWKNFHPGHNSAAFLRDRFGFVHLKGLVDAEHPGAGCSLNDALDTWIFRLPDGYRPARRELHVTLTNSALGRINIDGPVTDRGAGAVSIDPPTTFANAQEWISLDGISFRCAPSGQNGCP
jgi:hypothetical protein